MNDMEEFAVGDLVNVEPLAGDLFTHEFTGRIVDIDGHNIIVQDYDGDNWSVWPNQISHSSDEIIH